jgi:hypothetical protein
MQRSSPFKRREEKRTVLPRLGRGALEVLTDPPAIRASQSGVQASSQQDPAMTTLEGTGVSQPGAGTLPGSRNQPLGSYPRPCAINDLQLLERLAQIIGDLRL